MNSPEKLLHAFAEFVQRRQGAALYRYAGYTGLAGSLLLKVKATATHVAIRPWLRNRPVGLTDILRSDKRYKTFRGQEPDIYVHLGAHFRENAMHHARRSETSALIVFDSRHRAVGIVQSGNIPRPVLDALLAFCTENGLKATYDFSGTLVHRGFKGEVAQADRIAAREKPATLPLILLGQ